MNIYLIGYMYSGKTTLGHKLAVKLGYQWLDLDQVFEQVFHTSIPIFFKRYGEEAFRKLEQKLLHETANNDNTVISTGGGTPCFFDNIQWIKGAKENHLVVGSQARILYADCEGRTKIAAAFFDKLFHAIKTIRPHGGDLPGTAAARTHKKLQIRQLAIADSLPVQQRQFQLR